LADVIHLPPPRRVRLSPALLVQRDDHDTLRLIFGDEPHCTELTLTDAQAHCFAGAVMLMTEGSDHA